MKVWVLNAESLNGNILVFKEYKEAVKTFNNFLSYEIIYDLQYKYATLIEALDRWHKYKNTGRLPVYDKNTGCLPVYESQPTGEMLMEIIETNLI